MRLLLATHNEGKVRELSRMLPGYELAKLDSGTPLPPEDGETFEANALVKALAAATLTGETSVGEDSGIEAAALGGAPGVRSARFASAGDGNASDSDNLAKLMREAPAGSGLRYVCALAYVDPATGAQKVFHGHCQGRMAPAPRGQRGFGYDPVFLPDAGPDGLTMAELSDDQKDAISHRGQAARQLVQWLASER